jgi:hypothetical protein
LKGGEIISDFAVFQSDVSSKHSIRIKSQNASGTRSMSNQ